MIILLMLFMIPMMMPEGVLRNGMNWFGELLSNWFGGGVQNKTLEEILSDPNQRFSSIDFIEEEAREQFAAALNFVTETGDPDLAKLDELLSMGPQLLSILRRNGVDVSVTVGSLRENPSRLTALFSNPGIMRDILSNPTLSDFFVRQMLTNTALGPQILEGLDIDPAYRGVLSQTIREGGVPQEAINAFIRQLHTTDGDLSVLQNTHPHLFLNLLGNNKEQYLAMKINDLLSGNPEAVAAVVNQTMTADSIDINGADVEGGIVTRAQITTLFTENGADLRLILGDRGVALLANQDFDALINDPNQLVGFLTAPDTFNIILENAANGAAVEEAAQRIAARIAASDLPADFRSQMQIGFVVLGAGRDDGGEGHFLDAMREARAANPETFDRDVSRIGNLIAGNLEDGSAPLSAESPVLQGVNAGDFDNTQMGQFLQAALVEKVRAGDLSPQMLAAAGAVITSNQTAAVVGDTAYTPLASMGIQEGVVDSLLTVALTAPPRDATLER